MSGGAVISPIGFASEDGRGGWQSANETEGVRGVSAGTVSPEMVGCREYGSGRTDAPGVCCV